MGLDLLSLPNEILSRIVDEVLSPNPLPKLATDKTPLTKYHISFARRVGSYHTRFHEAFYEDSQKLASLVPGILLVNKRLRAVVLSHLRCSGSRDCAVDVVLLNEVKLITSWRSLPACTYVSNNELEPGHATNREVRERGLEQGNKSHHLDTVTCTMRPWGVYKFDVSKSESSGRPILRLGHEGFGVNCGGPPSLVWTFYDALVRFIKFGPRWTSRATDTAGSTHEIEAINTSTKDDVTSKVVDEPELQDDKHNKLDEESDELWSVRTFIFDILTPESEEALLFGGPLSKYRPRAEARRLFRKGGDWHPGEVVLDPKILADFVSRYISMLVRLDMGYGDILYKHVGRVIIRFDGEERARFDLDKRLLELDETWKGSVRQVHLDSTYRAWKPLVVVRRAQLGLEEPFNSIKDEIDFSLHCSYKSWASCHRSTAQ